MSFSCEMAYGFCRVELFCYGEYILPGEATYHNYFCLPSEMGLLGKNLLMIGAKSFRLV